MTLYAESSGILAWLLQEPRGADIERLLIDGGPVVTSALTLIECDRVLHRAVRLGASTTADAAALQKALNDAVASWNIQPLDTATIERARQPFPDDRIRALDAIHLASILAARSAIDDLEVLSLDDRVRSNAARLGFGVLPD